MRKPYATNTLRRAGCLIDAPTLPQQYLKHTPCSIFEAFSRAGFEFNTYGEFGVRLDEFRLGFIEVRVCPKLAKCWPRLVEVGGRHVVHTQTRAPGLVFRGRMWYVRGVCRGTSVC